MFRPIKNLFISYLQKNTKDDVREESPHDDETAEAVEESVESKATMSGSEPSPVKEIEKRSIMASDLNDTQKRIFIEMGDVGEDIGENIGTENSSATTNQLLLSPSVAASDEKTEENSNDGLVNPILIVEDENDDDIERQIKSVVMVKHSSKLSELLCNRDIVSRRRHSTELDENETNYKATVVWDNSRLKQLLNKPTGTEYLIDDEICKTTMLEQLLSKEPSKTKELTDDEICSLVSTELGDDVTPEESSFVHTIDEDEHDDEGGHFLEFTQDIESFSGSEIVVVETDLNSSIASDVPSEDPLAIDEFTQPILRDINSNMDSSSNNDDTSVAWINIDDITTNDVMNHNHIDGPQKRPPLSAVTTSPSSSSSTALAPETSVVEPNASNSNKSMSDEPSEELRSDGSDSGLGSETSALVLQNSLTRNISEAPTSSSSILLSVLSPMSNVRKPLRSNLKRRLDSDDDVLYVGNSLANCDDRIVSVQTQQLKKPKRSINFDGVQLYYFPRQQGFGCVPSAGGCTLGMGQTHTTARTITLAEHAAELRRAHRLQQQELQPRGGGSGGGGSSSDDSEESEEDYLSEGSGSDMDAESSGFLQPVSPKQRRAILKAAGVRKIDASEKADCRDIRNSREVCGCSCREFCDPETCACSQAGIKCQVDRAMFPCGCTRDACGNTSGRVEFNPQRVRVHFIHTLMRLEMENRQQQNPIIQNTRSSPNNSNCASVTASYAISLTSSASPSVSGVHQNSVGGTGDIMDSGGIGSYRDGAGSCGSYYGISQTQSNYSSGYASPVYALNDPAAGYYQSSSSSHPTGTHHHHHYSGLSPALADLELPGSTTTHTPRPPPSTVSYGMDTLDGGLFAGSAITVTPSYGDMLPTYGAAMTSTSAAGTTPYHHNLGGYLGSTNDETQVSGYAIYTNSSADLTTVGHHRGGSTMPTTYSSCAVPSAPPYGTATTTASAPEYQTDCSAVLATTTAPSCIELEGGGNGGSGSSSSSVGSCVPGAGDRSFIDLDTPIASSARLSQINDLLQHNRNTTAALVAVTHANTICLTMSHSGVQSSHHRHHSSSSSSSNSSNSNISVHAFDSSIDTPPAVDDTTMKNCLGFENLPSPLHPTPIIAVLENGTIADIIPISDDVAKTPSTQGLVMATKSTVQTTSITPPTTPEGTTTTTTITVNASTKDLPTAGTVDVVVEEEICDNRPNSNNMPFSTTKLPTNNEETITPNTATNDSEVTATVSGDMVHEVTTGN